MPSVTTHGADIFYQVHGGNKRTDNDPLVLVPGLGAHSRIWLPFPMIFSKQRPVVTYDPRGLGRSTAGNEELTLDVMASDVKAVLDDAGIERAAFLGASMGALVLVRLALDHPEIVTKLIFVTPGVIRTRYGDWLLETLQLFQERLKPDEYLRAVIALAFAPPFFEKSYGVVKEVGRMLAPTDKEFEQIGRQLACLEGFDISDEVPGIDMPTLIIAGERDALAPIEGARKLAAKIRGSRLITFSHAGHSPFVEARDEVLKAIEEFL